MVALKELSQETLTEKAKAGLAQILLKYSNTSQNQQRKKNPCM